MNSSEIDVNARLLLELRNVADEVQSEIAAIESALHAAMLIGKTEKLLGCQYIVCRKTTVAERFDRQNFRQNYADLYRQYSKSVCNSHLIISDSKSKNSIE